MLRKTTCRHIECSEISQILQKKNGDFFPTIVGIPPSKKRPIFCFA